MGLFDFGKGKREAEERKLAEEQENLRQAEAKAEQQQKHVVEETKRVNELLKEFPAFMNHAKRLIASRDDEELSKIKEMLKNKLVAVAKEIHLSGEYEKSEIKAQLNQMKELHKIVGRYVIKARKGLKSTNAYLTKVRGSELSEIKKQQKAQQLKQSSRNLERLLDEIEQIEAKIQPSLKEIITNGKYVLKVHDDRRNTEQVMYRVIDDMTHDSITDRTELTGGWDKIADVLKQMQILLSLKSNFLGGILLLNSDFGKEIARLHEIVSILHAERVQLAGTIAYLKSVEKTEKDVQELFDTWKDELKTFKKIGKRYESYYDKMGIPNKIAGFVTAMMGNEVNSGGPHVEKWKRNAAGLIEVYEEVMFQAKIFVKQTQYLHKVLSANMFRSVGISPDFVSEIEDTEFVLLNGLTYNVEHEQEIHGKMAALREATNYIRGGSHNDYTEADKRKFERIRPDAEVAATTLSHLHVTVSMMHEDQDKYEKLVQKALDKIESGVEELEEAAEEV